MTTTAKDTASVPVPTLLCAAMDGPNLIHRCSRLATVMVAKVPVCAEHAKGLTG